MTAGSCLAQSLTDVTLTLTTDSPNASLVLKKGESFTIDFSNLQAAEQKAIDASNNALPSWDKQYPITFYDDDPMGGPLCYQFGSSTTITGNAGNGAGTEWIKIICSAMGGDNGQNIPCYTGTVTVTVQ